MEWQLQVRPNRNTDFWASDVRVVSSYTLDHTYVSPYTIITSTGTEQVKVQPAGSILSFNPTTKKVVPHFTSYGFGPIGVLTQDAHVGDNDTNYRDKAVGVVWRGDVKQDYLWDNGIYGTVTAETKDALSDRITFVDEGKHF